MPVLESLGVSERLDADEFALNWTVWHELGHYIEKSYSLVAEPEPVAYEFLPRTSTDMNQRTIESGLSDTPRLTAEIAERTGVDISHIVESERFAEGVSRIIMSDWLVAERGLDINEAAQVVNEMQLYREQKFTARQEEREKELATAGSLNTNAMHEYAYGSANGIGYAHPHERETLFSILEASKVWEDQPVKPPYESS